MREVSKEKLLINASVKKTTVESIQKLLQPQNRKFSEMVDILLSEAIEARNQPKNQFNHPKP